LFLRETSRPLWATTLQGDLVWVLVYRRVEEADLTTPSSSPTSWTTSPSPLTGCRRSCTSARASSNAWSSYLLVDLHVPLSLFIGKLRPFVVTDKVTESGLVHRCFALGNKKVNAALALAGQSLLPTRTPSNGSGRTRHWSSGRKSGSGWKSGSGRLLHKCSHKNHFHRCIMP
jgi:hypothetical protein